MPLLLQMSAETITANFSLISMLQMTHFVTFSHLNEMLQAFNQLQFKAIHISMRCFEQLLLEWRQTVGNSPHIHLGDWGFLCLVKPIMGDLFLNLTRTSVDLTLNPTNRRLVTKAVWREACASHTDSKECTVQLRSVASWCLTICWYRTYFIKAPH